MSDKNDYLTPGWTPSKVQDVLMELYQRIWQNDVYTQLEPDLRRFANALIDAGTMLERAYGYEDEELPK